MGDAIPGPAGTPPKPPVAGEKPGISGALVLPVVFTAATLTVDRFTRSSLGDWRYIPTVILGLCALYFTMLAAVAFLIFTVGEHAGREKPPGRVARTMKALFGSRVLVAACVAVAAGVELVRAVDDHSVIGSVSAILTVLVVVLALRSIKALDEPDGRWRFHQIVGIVVTVWLLVVNTFHLH